MNGVWEKIERWSTGGGQVAIATVVDTKKSAPQPPGTKMAVNNYIRVISSLVLPLSLTLEERTLASRDHREAVQAFQEKRGANFTGR